MTIETETDEREKELGRVEAFSDGVVAIIVTIMVLELKVPEHDDLAGLLPLWPLFLAYLLSFVYVGIYWVNHHRLFTHARRVTNGLLWSNLALLFTLSLVPFATAYLGEHHFTRFAVTFYLAVLALPSLTYSAMERCIETQAGQSKGGRDYLAATRRKGYVSSAVYIAGVAASFWSSAAALTAAVIVAILWIAPVTPFDRLFASADRSHRKTDHG